MSSRPVVIADLGLGNLRSVARAFERVGARPTITADPAQVERAERLVVPGQGAFRDAAAALSGDLGAAVREVLRAGRPYLGICLGMQALFEASDEAPDASGLGWFPGHVRRFSFEPGPATSASAARERLKVPHIGWNEVYGDHPLLPQRAWFYFVHSYHCVPDDPAITVGTAEHGAAFCAAVAAGAVFACQFHPEKSHRAGAQVLDRFMSSWS
jgi:glutamine amidotransferase